MAETATATQNYEMCKSNAISDPEKEQSLLVTSTPHLRIRSVITVIWETSIQCSKCQVIPATLKRVTTVSVYSLHTVIMENKCKGLGLMPDT